MVLLVNHNRPPPKVSKLEDDAVFSYWRSAGLMLSWLMDMTVTKVIL